RWQAISRDNEWYRFVTESASTGRNPFNIEFNTRYPLAYDPSYFSSASAYSRWITPYPWMTTGYVDPRTGQPQYPIIARESALGARNNGRINPPGTLALSDAGSTQAYRHGWRSVKMFE